MAIANITGNILTDTGVAISSLVSGSGTTNYHAKFTGASTLGNSLIFDNGTNAVGINTTSPSTFANYTNLSLKAIGASGVNLDFFNSGGTRQASIVLDSSVGFNLNANAAIPMVFATNDAERMRITSSGNVGIGTSSPSVLLHAFNSSGTAELRLERGGTGDVGMRWKRNNSDLGYVSNADWIIAGASSTDFAVNAVNNLIFGTNSTERMRIGSQGNIGIGQVNASDVRLFVRSAGSGASTYNIYSRDVNAVDLFVIRDDGYGYLKAAAWAYGSDRRIKENINYIETGLDKVLALKPATFDYIDGVKNNIGWIAQDVQEVIPEAVNTISEKNDQLTLKSDFIVPYLVKAIQELEAKVSALENKS